MGACLNLVDRRILNLAINARNAMPKGGRKRLVVLEIREFKVMVADLSHTEMSEGNVMASPNGSRDRAAPAGTLSGTPDGNPPGSWMQFNLHRSDESNWERSVAVITQVIGPAE
jgi:hypothetical protein